MKTWIKGSLIGIGVSVIATAITWEEGKSWAWYQPIASAVRWILGLLSYTAPVPVWMILLFVALAAFGCRYFCTLHRSRTTVSLPAGMKLENFPPLDVLRAPREMSKDEELALEALFHADGEWIEPKELAEALKMRVVAAEAALESLVGSGYAIDRLNALSGPSYRLTTLGLSYAKRKGWL